MDSNLIYLHLSGELDEQQTKKLLDWVNASEVNKKFYTSIKNAWTISGLKNQSKELDLTHEFELLKIRLNQLNKPGKSVVRIKTFKKFRSGYVTYFLRIAAILLFLCSVGSTTYYFIRNQKVNYNVIVTKRGEKSRLVLSDGTTIWLNSETTLKYPANIFRKKVHIYLDGEAYFDVTKHHGRKLIINTSNINITVLGTCFNVKSYANEETVETTLEKGIIIITRTDKQKSQSIALILKPNQQATYIKKNRKIFISDLHSEDSENQEQTSDPDNENLLIHNNTSQLTFNHKNTTKLYTAWKDGQLVFKSERFEDLAKRMERWYDIQLVIKNQDLKNSKYTGRFEKETVEQALKALSLSLPFTYTIDHNKVTISEN